MQNWIKCSERMPEQFREVLVITDCHSMWIAALNRDMKWDDGDFYDDITNITH